MENYNINEALASLKENYEEDKASEIIETLLYNPMELTDSDHEIIDQLDTRFLRTVAQIFIEDLAYDFNTLVNYWEAFIGQLTEEQTNKVLEYAIEQTDVDFVEDFIIGYRKFYTNPEESITFFSKLDPTKYHEITFFIGRCYEAQEEYQKAIDTYTKYLSHPYFGKDENLEQAAVNKFYIDHTIASLYFKLNNMDKVVEIFNEIIKPHGINNYLENFSNPQDTEFKQLLLEYIQALEHTNKHDKAEEYKKIINNFYL